MFNKCADAIESGRLSGIIVSHFPLVRVWQKRDGKVFNISSSRDSVVVETDCKIQPIFVSTVSDHVTSNFLSTVEFFFC